ncbi:hypothetical protein [uncultured Jatrophihabitans sp.]|uniref:hypothetical protein n=1 Tax=uncultured Jatrophihabitans sp. TaxID=1610747 RepID=UPI0035CBF434
MPTQINGLPAHVLLIHVIVVLAPLGALFTVLSAVWPAARRRIGIVGPITTALVLVFTPITTNAGEWLEHKLEANGANKAIEKHADLGDTFLWYAIGLFVVSVGVWLWGRRRDAVAGPVRTKTTGEAAGDDAAERAGGGTATLVRTDRRTAPESTGARVTAFVVGFVSVAVSVLVVWQVYRIGDSGAHAAWDYVHHLK